MSCPSGTVHVGAQSLGGPGLPGRFSFTVVQTGPVTVAWNVPSVLGALQCNDVSGCMQIVIAGAGAESQWHFPPGSSGSHTWTLTPGFYTCSFYQKFQVLFQYTDLVIAYTLTGACNPTPPTPTGLRVVSATTTSVTLACNNMGAGFQYAWFQNAIRVGNFTSAPTVTIVGLRPSTAYTLGCETVTPGQTPWSALASIRATTAAPGCPTCPSCKTCSNPAIGCVPVVCPSGQTCQNGSCGGATPPPIGTGDSTVLVLAAVVVGGIWVLRHHSNNPVAYPRAGSARRRYAAQR